MLRILNRRKCVPWSLYALLVCSLGIPRLRNSHSRRFDTDSKSIPGSLLNSWGCTSAFLAARLPRDLARFRKESITILLRALKHTATLSTSATTQLSTYLSSVGSTSEPIPDLTQFGLIPILKSMPTVKDFDIAVNSVIVSETQMYDEDNQTIQSSTTGRTYHDLTKKPTLDCYVIYKRYDREAGELEFFEFNKHTSPRGQCLNAIHQFTI